MNLQDTAQLLFTLESLIFFATILFHFIKKYKTLIGAYVCQSFGVIVLLGVLGIVHDLRGLLLSSALMAVVKILLAPLIFFRAMRGSDERVTSESYVTIPWALLVMVALFLFSISNTFSFFGDSAPYARELFGLALAGIFISLFLTINSRSIPHQIIGVLGMENNIVVLGSVLGIEHTSALELGIVFDVCVWMVGASLFITLIRQHFGALDASRIQDLKD